MRNFVQKLKNKIGVVAVACVAVMATCVSAFAEGSGTANSAVTTAMTSVANDMTATGTAIIPIALGVVGLVIVVRYGIKVFKSIGNK